MYYGGVNMISVRLSKELEDKIDQLSKQESVTKSAVSYTHLTLPTILRV